MEATDDGRGPGADDQIVAEAEVRELKRQIRELEHLLGTKTLEDEISGKL